MSTHDRDLRHKKLLAKEFDKYREDYKAKLNPEEYPGNMSLIFELDTKVCVITADDIEYVGELSSFDQFGNIILAKAVLRTFGPNGYDDEEKLGTIFIRSDQVILIGKVDKDKENKLLEVEEEDADE
ncbi:Sm protein [Trichomonas vaginalis G3]|uniref:Sm protein n=1 Tax=Trichomonas vaginalis (strain ATCC PRA-98 / G3) TaxID=412133 RepID=A2F979_TRIV3|nr:U6 snRNA-associated Sm-like protein Lsm1/8 family [Trichomonas vaginalis G3]EAX98557.1 Sm protein [Trichomonas vaginalis G3]KAI5553056.1 U6 snRNA-associated Sm-like protein Lsm1/8 family [Trichomonas vaginalis G3]|eukprot:XP_001311487.1 Sm protein [Trichomonas vaginalis G3]